MEVVGVALLENVSDEESLVAVLGRDDARAEVTGTGEPGARGDGPFTDARSVFCRVGDSEGGGND